MTRIGFDIGLLVRGARGSIRGGGLGRVVAELARSLHAREDLDLLCLSLGHARDLRDLRATVPGLPVWEGRLVQREVFAALGGLAEEGRAAIRPLARRARNLLDDWWAPALPRDLDLVHSPFDPIPAVVRRRTPHLLTVADLIPITMPQYCEDGFVRWFQAVHLPQLGAHAWIHCISEGVRCDLLRTLPGLDPFRVRVVHLGCGPAYRPALLSRTEVSRRLGLPDVPWIATLSTIEARKNLETVVRAFLLACRDPSFRAHLLVVGGAGWKTGALEQALSEAGVSAARIHITGFVAEEVLPDLLGACSAFVSMSRAEGFGLPPLEAMACGVPVVLSDIPAHREVAAEAAVYLDVEDATGLAEAMRSLEDDAPGIARRRRVGLERASRLTWSACASGLSELYREILEDRRWKR